MKSEFDLKWVAERYVRGRPYFHPVVAARIQNLLRINQPLGRALDVGCGTGKSTVALKEIVENIVGMDISQEMLDFALPDNQIRYINARAEALPFADNLFDLVTCGEAFHWFDRMKFLSEVRRVLQPNAWLVIYTHSSSGHMVENPAFNQWIKKTYFVKYPWPPRHKITNYERFLDEAFASAGFECVAHEAYETSETFTPEELVNYACTGRNIMYAIEKRRSRIEDVETWLRQELQPLFVKSTGTFLFKGLIWFLRKTECYNATLEMPGYGNAI